MVTLQAVSIYQEEKDQIEEHMDRDMRNSPETDIHINEDDYERVGTPELFTSEQDRSVIVEWMYKLCETVYKSEDVRHIARESFQRAVYLFDEITWDYKLSDSIVLIKKSDDITKQFYLSMTESDQDEEYANKTLTRDIQNTVAFCCSIISMRHLYMSLQDRDSHLLGTPHVCIGSFNDADVEMTAMKLHISMTSFQLIHDLIEQSFLTHISHIDTPLSVIQKRVSSLISTAFLQEDNAENCQDSYAKENLLNLSGITSTMANILVDSFMIEKDTMFSYPQSIIAECSLMIIIYGVSGFNGFESAYPISELTPCLTKLSALARDLFRFEQTSL